MTGRPVDTSDKARSTKPAMEPAATTMPRSKSPSQSKVAAAVTSENKLTELQEKMKKSLSGGRFRMINEKLYTTTSNVAVELFKDEPETFHIYHEGFRAQVESWPSNPVDQYIKSLSTLRGTKTTRKGDPIVIADMGCGEAALAKSLISLNTDAVTRFRVHSFDLASPNDFVVACDIRHVPLEDDAVDVVVFSLSLMGTNFLDFLREAWRILKMGGQLKIAEVVSRFPDVSKFIAALVEIGFKLVSKNTSNKMFIFFEFTKVVERSEKPKSMKHASDEGGPLLTPCIYKKR
ncbi:ribosomal RNA-processing protein 8-like protein [Chytriomyces sp. MP71]|nr:ribosomal RNA-processing protein 8-like protein [Chytriomyces sp. MP71]